MRQVWITKVGAPEVLVVKEAPDPQVSAGEVRVRVRASGVNFADLMARVGLYPDAPKLPCVVGYEVSGVVDQVGHGVTDLQEGDRVLALCRFGGYSDVVVLPRIQVFRAPERLSFEAAAAFPVVYGTAYNMMLFTGNLRQGSTVLIHSAAGGVGQAAIQLARTRECTIIGVASSSKHEFLKQRGCDFTLDSAGDYTKGVRDIVADRGVDLILDPIGGKSWSEGYDLLAPCGRMVFFGLSAAISGQKRQLLHAGAELFHSRKKWGPMQLMADNKTLSGTNMLQLFHRPDLLAPQFMELLRLYDAGALDPHVDRTFRFDEAPAAHAYIHDRKAKGKVLLVP